jgi:sugar phosphate permease
MQATIQKEKLFYGWWIVLIASTALMIGNGLTIGGLPAFTSSMLRELVAAGAVRPAEAQQVIGDAAGAMVWIAGGFSLAVGWLIGRINLRFLMALGCVLLGAGLFVYSRIDSPRDVMAAYVIYGFSLGLVGLMVQTVLISNWFSRLRGRAMAFVVIGTSLGGMLVPLAATVLIPEVGWRNAVLILSSFSWLLMLVVLAFVRSTPYEMGLMPDGDASITENQQQLSGMRFGETVRTLRFWALALCSAAIFYAIFTNSQQFIQYLKSPRIGLSESQGNLAQTLTFVASVGGKFFFGWLSDRLRNTLVMILCCSMMFGGTLTLLNLTATTAFVFIVLFGIGYGGTFVLIQLLAVGSFGRRDAPKIMGVISFVETVGSGLGTIITGRLARAAGGDYSQAFYGLIMAAGLALISSLIVHFLIHRKGD